MLEVTNHLAKLAKHMHDVRTQRESSKAEALVVLSFHEDRSKIISGMLERRLRKLKGVKEIFVNHSSRTVRIHYDPRAVSLEKIRSVLKELGQGAPR